MGQLWEGAKVSVGDFATPESQSLGWGEVASIEASISVCSGVPSRPSVERFHNVCDEGVHNCALPPTLELARSPVLQKLMQVCGSIVPLVFPRVHKADGMRRGRSQMRWWTMMRGFESTRMADDLVHHQPPVVMLMLTDVSHLNNCQHYPFLLDGRRPMTALLRPHASRAF